MSEIENQLKKALIDVIKDKNLQKLELKKSLLKTLEEGIDQDIKNIENNLNHLENLEPETLTTVFSQIKFPILSPFAITNFSIAIDNFCSENSQLFVDILIKANNEFFMKTNFKNPGSNNPYFVPPVQPFFQAPQFGQQFTEPNNFGFQPPFNFQSPPGPFPGFQGNRPTSQQSSGWSFNSVHKKFLIEKLESIYKNLSEQEIGEELLSEFEKVMNFCQNLNS